VFTGNHDLNTTVRATVFERRIFERGPCKIEIYIDLEGSISVNDGIFRLLETYGEAGIKAEF